MKRRAMKLWRDIKKVTRFDLALFHGRKKLVYACVGVTLVPALYACIYLSSAWDPYAHLEQLQVAVVNLDVGAEANGQPVNLGTSMVDGLLAKHTFTFMRVGDERTARSLVTSGDASFALIIPPDLSASAMRATGDHAGRVRVLYSEGNNFMISGVAKRFAAEFAHSTNEALNAKRWGVVFDTVDASKEELARLKDGVAQLTDGAAKLDEGLEQAHAGSTALATGAERAHAGAERLADGAHQVAAGTSALTTGVGKLGDGLKTMRDRLPADESLSALAQGASQVAAGQQKLTAGLEQLADGSDRARDGARQLKEGTAGIPLVGGKVSQGAGKLEAGLTTLSQGTAQARDGSRTLADGSLKVADGTARLTSGVAQLGGGIRTMADKVPDQVTLAKLSNGAGQVADGTGELNMGLGKLSAGAAKLDDGLARLSDGADRLHGGLTQLSDGLTVKVERPAGDPQGLAASVEPQLEALTEVGAYGNSMAPYFLGLSLWVGVVMMGFIFQLRWFPQRVSTVNRLALVLGRMAVPLVLVTSQATLLTLALRFVLHAQMPSFWHVWLIAVLSSVTFLTMLLMLIGLLGDVGKVAALLLLVFQMGASGGVFPKELSGALFRFVHPWLPFTWVVRAGRAAMFGAFDGAWASALGMVVLFGIASVTIASLLGRWKFVARHRFTPLLDV